MKPVRFPEWARRLIGKEPPFWPLLLVLAAMLIWQFGVTDGAYKFVTALYPLGVFWVVVRTIGQTVRGSKTLGLEDAAVAMYCAAFIAAALWFSWPSLAQSTLLGLAGGTFLGVFVLVVRRLRS